MTARQPTPTTWLTFALILTVAAVSGCARYDPKSVPVNQQEFELGGRRVQAIVPTGWEAIDHGSTKRFRKGEFEIVLRNLGPAKPSLLNLEAVLEWGLVEVGHDERRREEKSRRAVTVDGREAFDIETWNRLDHTNPQRIFFVIDDGDLLALHTERMAFDDSLAAFNAIRDSLHLLSTRR